MSTVGTIAKIATDVVGKAAHAATHPVGTASAVVGRAYGIAATIVTGSRTEESAEESAAASPAGSAAGSSAASSEAPSYPKAPHLKPVEPQEPSTTEPKAASREGAHHGRGAEPTDDWHDELDDGQDAETSAGTPGVAADVNPNTGLPHTQQRDDEPLLDPSLTKQVKSEAETMRKASEPAGE